MSGQFIIVVECHEAKNGNGVVITKDGDKVVIVDDEWGPSSSSFRGEKIPKDAKLFDSRESAEDFSRNWKGHPWCCMPKSYEIFTVEPVFKQVFDHYILAGE